MHLLNDSTRLVRRNQPVPSGQTTMNPGDYEAWHKTARGSWIADREFDLMMRLLDAPAGATLLDVGCGTGHFSRRFAAAGLRVAGLDPDPAMLEHARGLGGGVSYLPGTGTVLPFGDNAYDYVTAVTSLCFIADPERALRQIWRVARRAVLLGLLNRRSLLYRQKRGRGAYRGAHWDIRPRMSSAGRGNSNPRRGSCRAAPYSCPAATHSRARPRRCSPVCCRGARSSRWSCASRNTVN